jgi:CO/xanthine dehydrogenase Mo-binding subunit
MKFDVEQPRQVVDINHLALDKIEAASDGGVKIGGKLWPWNHSLLAAAAARNLRRPVKLVVSRKSMFSSCGHRPRTAQRIRLSATAGGKLTSLQHDYVNATSMLDDYEENCGEATPFLYSTPNLRVTSGLAHRNVGTPTSMRGPGAVAGIGRSKGTFMDKAKKVSSHSFGAHFVEVTWQPEAARLRVTRVLSMIDAGQMINARTAKNQIEGAVVMGIGMALFEHTTYDKKSGAPINSNLADYVVSTHADAPALEVEFLNYPDYNLNALGARGVGEIGLAGTAAAIVNAVYHATGKRVREPPVKIEDLI